MVLVICLRLCLELRVVSSLEEEQEEDCWRITIISLVCFLWPVVLRRLFSLFLVTAELHSCGGFMIRFY